VSAGSAAASGWTLRRAPPLERFEREPGEWITVWPNLDGVSCPTTSLCIAVGSEHTLAFSQAPTGTAADWHVVNPSAGPSPHCGEEEQETGEACYQLGGRLQAVSCSSPSLCVVITYEGFIYVSSEPTGPASSWLPTSINEPGGAGATHLTAISCPSSSLCVAVSGGSNNSNGGKVLTSTNPASGDWQVAQLNSSLDLRGVSCGTPSLCVAVAREGQLFVSTNPSGGAGAWRSIGSPGGPGDLEGVSCTSTALCAAGNQTGNVLTSTNPAADGGGWSETKAEGSSQITGISCPTASHCVAVDDNGDVLASDDPTGGPGSWHFENLVPFGEPAEYEPPRNALFAVSCASTSLCAAIGADGRIFTSTDPFSAPDPPAASGHPNAPRRPRTILVWAEHFWQATTTRRHHIRARFRFFSQTPVRGFECKRDHAPYRRCHSPLRYGVGYGRHVLRVRAIGPTGLRGPAATKRFHVDRPRQLSARKPGPRSLPRIGSWAAS
jgi:hypothetical protein